jgi:glycosyltransferase involved in cell wall biosynthesis
MKPLLSIVIATKNSGHHLERCLCSIENQSFKNFEIIVVDNQSTDDTKTIAKKHHVIFLTVKGDPPQVSEQRNAGIKTSSGEYVYVIDHDMELPISFIKKFYDEQKKTKNEKTIWCVPEKIKASSGYLSAIRTFENEIYNNTVIAAARIFKNSKTDKIYYDELFSGGPADWDFDMQYREQGYLVKTLSTYIIHHEEELDLFSYILKKSKYVRGVELYKKKWQSKNTRLYAAEIKKQFNPVYRFITIFMENGKWRKTLQNVHLYFAFILIKLLMSVIYLFKKNTYGGAK